MLECGADIRIKAARSGADLKIAAPYDEDYRVSSPIFTQILQGRINLKFTRHFTPLSRLTRRKTIVDSRFNRVSVRLTGVHVEFN